MPNIDISAVTPKGHKITISVEEKPNTGVQIYMTDKDQNIIANEFVERTKVAKVDLLLAGIEVFVRDLTQIFERTRG